jgi:hypothetical protein
MTHIDDRRIKEMEWLWTNSTNDTWLEEVDVEPGEKQRYLVFDKVNGAILIERSDLHDYVVEQMIKHGKRIVSSAEVLEQLRNHARESAKKHFLPMWTTERDKCRLVQVKGSDGQPIGFLVFNSIGQMIRIRSNYIYDYVVSHMLEAGVKVLEMQELLVEWQKIAEDDAEQRKTTE